MTITLRDIIDRVAGLVEPGDRAWPSEDWINPRFFGDTRSRMLAHCALRLAAAGETRAVDHVIELVAPPYQFVAVRHAFLGLAIRDEDAAVAAAEVGQWKSGVERLAAFWGIGMAALPADEVLELLPLYREALGVADAPRRDARLVALASRASVMTWPKKHAVRMALSIADAALREETLMQLAFVWRSHLEDWSVELVLSVPPSPVRDAKIRALVFADDPENVAPGDFPRLRMGMDAALRLVLAADAASLRDPWLEILEETARFNSMVNQADLAALGHREPNGAAALIGRRPENAESVFSDEPLQTLFEIPDWARAGHALVPVWPDVPALPLYGTERWWQQVVPDVDARHRAAPYADDELGHTTLVLVAAARREMSRGESETAERLLASARYWCQGITDPAWRCETRLAVAAALLGMREVGAAGELLWTVRDDLMPLIDADFTPEFSTIGHDTDEVRFGGARPDGTLRDLLDRLAAVCYGAGSVEMVVWAAGELPRALYYWVLVRTGELVVERIAADRGHFDGQRVSGEFNSCDTARTL